MYVFKISDEKCCPFKDVGGKIYKFVDHVSDEEKDRFKCSDTCAYEYAGKETGEKFCFRPGQLESKCTKSGKLSCFILPNC